jgi:Putative Flp pilus-assembly TadE/G-like
VARFQSEDESRDAGVILVFWVLCLSLLSALFVGVLALGNLLQSSDNAQNAADAAALAGEDYLAGIHTVGLMVENNIPIDWGDRCQVGGSNVAVQCANYSWLYGYSIYERNNWVPIGDRSSAINALSYADSAWTCGRLATRSRHHHSGQTYCVELKIYPPGHGYGVDGSLSDDPTINVATDATNDAVLIEQNYGFSNSAGCTAPQGVFLAEGSSQSCIGYDAAGSVWVTVPDPAVFPGTGIAQIDKTSWATTFPGGTGLCSGIPPDGNCN